MFTAVSGGGIYAIMGVTFGACMLAKSMRTVLHYLGLA